MMEEHRHQTSSEGELDSSSDSESEETKKPLLTDQVSQSWTSMLTEQNLSSIMSNALNDKSEIIHIDDPIAQETTNSSSYVFPSGTNVDKYFQRKKQQDKDHRANRKDLKNLSKLLNKEKNIEILRTIIETVGKQRAFQYARQAVELYRQSNEKQCANGQTRTLGGFYLKMLINDKNNDYLSEHEREEIHRRNQKIQKELKKQRKKNKPSS